MKPLENNLGWNKRKVFLFISIAVILLLGALMYLGKNNSQIKGTSTEVQQNSDSFNKVSSDLSQSVREKVLSIQDEARSLNVSDVSTSSPQIQKIIKDIKGLESLPSDKVRETCQKICSGL